VTDVLQPLVHHSQVDRLVYSSEGEAGEASENVHRLTEPIHALVVIVVSSPSDPFSSLGAIDQVDGLF